MLCLLVFTSGCSKESNVELCSSDKARRYLVYNFGYELVRETSAPQLNILSVVADNDSPNMVWCSARAELRGNGIELVNALQLRIGAKRWRQMKEYIEGMDLSKIEKESIRKTSNHLALYILSKYEKELKDKHELVLPIKANYVLNKHDGNIESIEYSSNLNLQVFKLLQHQLRLTDTEADVAREILK